MGHTGGLGWQAGGGAAWSHVIEGDRNSCIDMHVGRAWKRAVWLSGKRMLMREDRRAAYREQLPLNR